MESVPVEYMHVCVYVLHLCIFVHIGELEITVMGTFLEGK